ncbi:MFS transporter [Methylocystis heyeri]|uniref:MFS transporter n=1 Tax=Methylocystis heyeri TaxID=391905 RepID=A0A6B8KEA0_9HYPH|nr:MFS transporter [Methylocystis heyeri]QGM44750.1 MFS transporter [Methylocystis heyeri]
MLKPLRQIPRGVWALGVVSLLMDLSSEMIHALLPVYLVGVLGASMVEVGAIEGIAEATASIVKIFSGALSDWLGKRKWLAVLGYGLAAVTKPAFPLAQGVDLLIAARFIDRVGKGIRGAPRDALVADITPPELRGAAFGLRQSMDTVGAFLGPAAAIGLMWLTANDFKVVFWVAVIPAILAVAVLIAGVGEPDRANGGRKARFPLHVDELRRLGGAYWLIVGVATAFSLARFSEAFLILRARDAGLAVALAPLVLVGMNVVYALAAYPVGAISDNRDRTTPLALGLVLLIAADAALANLGGLDGVALGVALWGLHMGFTQGLLATLVADVATPELRGTAFGVFNLFGGVATLASSLAAGALWEAHGAETAFWASAGCAGLALLGLWAAKWRMPELGRNGG